MRGSDRSLKPALLPVIGVEQSLASVSLFSCVDKALLMSKSQSIRRHEEGSDTVNSSKVACSGGSNPRRY